MSHDTLENWYMTIFSMIHRFKYNLNEIENMIIYEKDLYLQMVLDAVKQEQDMAQSYGS